MPQTRERLLDAALRAFAIDGVAGTAITDLEDAAGLAPGSGGFYRYFKTKDEVLAAAVQREIVRVRERHAEHPDPVPSADGRAALRADLLDALEVLRGLGPLMGVLAREHGRIPELAAEVADHLVEGGLRHDVERLTALMASGGIPERDPKVLGPVLTSALIGYHLSTVYFGGPPGGVGADRFVDELVDLVAGSTTPG
ncbi:MAG: TetR/AcrR family transcriptional regulator [Acidimicrobiales bacterium]